MPTTSPSLRPELNNEMFVQLANLLTKQHLTYQWWFLTHVITTNTACWLINLSNLTPPGVCKTSINQTEDRRFTFRKSILLIKILKESMHCEPSRQTLYQFQENTRILWRLARHGRPDDYGIKTILWPGPFLKIYFKKRGSCGKAEITVQICKLNRIDTLHQRPVCHMAKQ